MPRYTTIQLRSTCRAVTARLSHGIASKQLPVNSSDPVKVTINATINKTTGALESWTVNGSAPTADVTVPVVKIENKKGALLPDTGGMGTVLFTVFGVLIVALGAGWYVKSNRKSRHAA